MHKSVQRIKSVNFLASSTAKTLRTPVCCRFISSVSLAYTRHQPESLQNDSTQSAPLIILHGLFASKNSWQSLCKRFANELGTQVIAVDARNHGESSHTAHMDYVLMADDINNLFKELNITQAHLLGHSMGGKTAMKFALRHSELLKSLVIEDVTPTPSPNSAEILQYIRAIYNVDLYLYGKKITALRRRAFLELENEIPNMGVRTLLLQNLVPDPDADKAKWRVNLDSIVTNIDALLGWDEDAVIGERFNGPTCFIGGANSTYMPGGTVEGDARKMIVDYFPKVKFNTIQDAGHWVHSEQPVKFTEVLCDFIKSVNQGQS